MNIAYHTRLSSDNTKKIVGGTFGGQIDQDTVERLVRNHFDVVVRSSGYPVFVDKESREVSLYLTVRPADTEKGKLAIKAYNLAKSAIIDEEETEIEKLLDELSHDEILRRLRNHT